MLLLLELTVYIVVSSLLIIFFNLFRLNWTRIVRKCEESSIKIYRTLSEDTSCNPIQFLPTNSRVKKCALVSYPGSGNTWIRHMIEQVTGVYTGTVYGDKKLFNSGKSIKGVLNPNF